MKENITVAEVLRERFIAHMRYHLGRKPATLHSYGIDIRQFQEWLVSAGLGKRSMGEITSGNVRQFLACERETYELCQKTVARKTAALRQFFHWMTRKKIIDKNPIARLSYPRTEILPPRVLAENEYHRLISHLWNAQSPAERRDYVTIELLYFLMLRVSEVSALSWGDIIWKKRQVRIGGTFPRTLTLIGGLESILRGHMTHLCRWQNKAVGDRDPVIHNKQGTRMSTRGISRLVRKHASVARIGTVTPHTLRHSMAVHHLRAGLERVRLAHLLGVHVNHVTNLYAPMVGKDRRGSEAPLP